MTAAKTLCGAILVSIAMIGCTPSVQPLNMEEVTQRSFLDLNQTLHQQEALTGPVDLYEAMARALKYNLDNRLKMMELCLSVQQQKVSRFDMLPKLVTSAGYQARDNYSGSSSMALEGPNKGNESLVSSTSQEKDFVTADVTMMWNVLDFGVSYVRAQQEGEKVFIAEERKRKTIQNILQEVRTAYWKAICAEVLISDVQSLLDETLRALEYSRKIETQYLGDTKKALEYQRVLLQNIQLLKGMLQNMRDAKTELARLMNVHPSDPFNLVVPEQFDELPQIGISVEALEKIALGKRPELHEEDYRARITALEGRKALLKMLPGLNLRTGFNLDTNDFLHNNQWWQAGAHVSWNLLKLFSQPMIYKTVQTQQEVDSLRRQALGMAILMQVQLAYDDFVRARDSFDLSHQLERVNQRLNELNLAQKESNVGNYLELIRGRITAMTTRMRKMMAYAELQQSYCRIINTIGVDMLPEDVDGVPVTAVQQSVRVAVERVENLLSGAAEAPL
ncbi:TolC family protein [Desulfuromonas thiophila]|uniref:TolC family protein n=1 Tax=Desulfuromonas thiophila TaxID=57664 RepID=UPI0024A988D6|nr:TolC family protein [Desulfuromonas thiophila]